MQRSSDFSLPSAFRCHHRVQARKRSGPVQFAPQFRKLFLCHRRCHGPMLRQGIGVGNLRPGLLRSIRFGGLAACRANGSKIDQMGPKASYVILTEVDVCFTELATAWALDFVLQLPPPPSIRPTALYLSRLQVAFGSVHACP